MSYPVKNSINYQFNFSWITILLTFILLSTIFSDSKAKEHEDFSERFRKLSNELRCPTCQGLSVQDSEAGFSKSIKNKIIELIKEGKTYGSGYEMPGWDGKFYFDLEKFITATNETS